MVGRLAERCHADLFRIRICECYYDSIIVDTQVIVDYTSPNGVGACSQTNRLFRRTIFPQVVKSGSCIKSNSCSVARSLVRAKVKNWQFVDSRQVERVNADALHVVNRHYRVACNYVRQGDCLRALARVPRVRYKLTFCLEVECRSLTHYGVFHQYNWYGYLNRYRVD